MVAWTFLKVEGFEDWARVFDSRSKGSRFDRLGFFQTEGFEVWARVLDSRSKGSRFYPSGCFLASRGLGFVRVCSFQGRRVRGLVAWQFFEVEGFEVWARVPDSRSKGSKFGSLGFF